MSLGIVNSIHGASKEVIGAIQNASKKTGVDFDYLVNQARTESSFRPDVKASTSSATGLYQFLDQTWLATVSQHGSKHGLVGIAAQIKQDFQGRYYVADDTVKQEILNLRTDPKISSLMAAEFASDNQAYLEKRIGREASATDLYFAHFLGAGGASKFLAAMQDDPNQPAAPVMTAAAKSNKNIFYNSDGSMKSLEQIYNGFKGKITQISTGHAPENASVIAAKNTYRPEPFFEKLYSKPVTNMVRVMPSMLSSQSDNFFTSMMAQYPSYLLQNQVIDPSLFLTLTMLDLPK